MSYKIVGIGETLWDMLPTGKQLGGAPGNFAYHARALGAEGFIISRVGQDELGTEILNRLIALGLPTQFVEVDPQKPTGTVSVELSPDGQPKYTIEEDVAWDYLAGGEKAEALVSQVDAICFGTLAQRSETSRDTIAKLVGIARKGALRILDVNLRQQFYSRELIEHSLFRANILKVNDGELPILAEMFKIPGDTKDQISDLASRFNLKAVACTRGGNGSLLYSNGEWSDHAGIQTKVADTIGAGDSFTAAMTIGLLSGWKLDRINDAANQVAAFVASQSGATPPLPSHLQNLFKSSQ